MCEFGFELKECFPHRITKLSPESLSQSMVQNYHISKETLDNICTVIDEFGQRSAKAQNLQFPITSAKRFMETTNQVIYVLSDVEIGYRGIALGFLKTGFKDLYLFDEDKQCRYNKMTPSILDFYVHENCQRKGFGKVLFNYMLVDNQWEPMKCAVDRPSEKMLNFLMKNYCLKTIIPQSNNFVLYKGFFEGAESAEAAADMHDKAKPSLAYRLSDANARTQLAPYGRYGARRVSDTRSRIFQL